MSITNEQNEEFLTHYRDLLNQAVKFTNSVDGRASETQIEENGGVSYMVNTACNCHPEYERQYLDQDEFIAFLNQQSTN